MLWFAVGYYVLIYLAGLHAIPLELYESAAVDGIGPFRRLVNITVPLLAPAITINTTLSTIGILSLFDLPFVLTRGGPGYLSETLALIAVVVTLLLLRPLRSREDVYG